jgi:transposase, IS30 family
MERSPNTISQEIKRNQVARSYDPKKAEHKAYVRRKYAKYQGMKIVEHGALRKEITERLMDDQSPEAIAGFIRRNRILPSISKDGIYRFVRSVYGRRIENHRKHRRVRRRGGRPKVTSLTNRTFIDERPRHINARSRIGDVEFDFIVSGRSGKGILLVVVDRKSRVTFMERITRVTILDFEQSFLRIKARFPEMTTGTTDNDILLKHHERLAKLLKIKIYFCHPYHSWEKGTVENTNKVIRRDIPKGSNISRYAKHFIEALEQKLNRRPMKCLDYRSPQEMLEAHRKRRNKKHRI